MTKYLCDKQAQWETVHTRCLVATAVIVALIVSTSAFHALAEPEKVETAREVLQEIDPSMWCGPLATATAATSAKRLSCWLALSETPLEGEQLGDITGLNFGDLPPFFASVDADRITAELTRYQQELDARLAAEAARRAEAARDPIERVIAVADSTPFDWRGNGVTFHLGCTALIQCTNGSYEYESRRIWVKPNLARADLESAVLHELAHAWQMTVRGWPAAAYDVSGWVYPDYPLRPENESDSYFALRTGLEAAAECLAAAWGAPRELLWWDCPAGAIAHMDDLFTRSQGR